MNYPGRAQDIKQELIREGTMVYFIRDFQEGAVLLFF